jgi:ankyrin repeat protein
MGAFDERTPLIWACLHGHHEHVKYLIAHGADINEQIYAKSALLWAIAAGHEDIAVELVACGAEVEFPGWNGKTALIYASYAGYKDVVRSLLTKGANATGNAPLDNKILWILGGAFV